MKNFEHSLKSGDLKKMAQADVEFHDVIYRATDNPKLINMLNNLREQMYRYRLKYLKDKRSHECLNQEHQKIYAGIRCGDKKAVAMAVCEHIDNQEKAILSAIREHQA